MCAGQKQDVVGYSRMVPVAHSLSLHSGTGEGFENSSAQQTGHFASIFLGIRRERGVYFTNSIAQSNKLSR